MVRVLLLTIVLMMFEEISVRSGFVVVSQSSDVLDGNLQCLSEIVKSCRLFEQIFKSVLFSATEDTIASP